MINKSDLCRMKQTEELRNPDGSWNLSSVRNILLNEHEKVFKRYFSDFGIFSAYMYNIVWGKRFAFRSIGANYLCGCEQKITINPYLKFAPETVIRGIIIHELGHIVYPNHGKEFHAFVDSFGYEEEMSKWCHEQSKKMYVVSKMRVGKDLKEIHFKRIYDIDDKDEKASIRLFGKIAKMGLEKYRKV